MTFLMFLAACGSPGTDTAGGDPACATLTPGTDWAWHGACPQMTTPVDVAVDGCALTLDYTHHDGMTMGMPYAGTVDGDTVTFAAGDTVTGCLGTVVSADRVDGTCDGGCAFSLKR